MKSCHLQQDGWTWGILCLVKYIRQKDKYYTITLISCFSHWVVFSSFATPWTIALTDSSIHGIFPARILEWVIISFSRRSSWSRDRTHVSCIGRLILYRWAIWETHLTSMCNAKPNQNQNKLIRKQIGGRQQLGCGRRVNWVKEVKRYKLLVIKAVSCIFMAVSLRCSLETTTRLLISYTPIQNKKFEVWGKNVMVMLYRMKTIVNNTILYIWKLLRLRELKLGLYNNVEGWERVGSEREAQEEGMYVHLWLIHVDVWRKSRPVLESPAEVWVSSSLPQRQGLWVQQTCGISPLGGGHL